MYFTAAYIILYYIVLVQMHACYYIELLGKGDEIYLLVFVYADLLLVLGKFL